MLLRGLSWTFVVALLLGACGGGSSEVDAGIVCPSLDEYCRMHPTTCFRSWDEARQPSHWCVPEYQGALVRIGVYEQCGGFSVVADFGVDTADVYYYALDSGALVGVELHGAVGTGCAAGHPPGTWSAQCTGAVTQVPCGKDAGAAQD